MQGMLETAVENPWATLEYVLDGPLHPGGTESTAALLDRADVAPGTRLLDVGCGAGTSLSLARERGAEPVGLDHEPPAGGVRGDLSGLPIQSRSFDVVLSECVTCLVADRRQAFDEIHRVLAPGGRLALSDVVVEGSVPEMPDVVGETLCLSNTASERVLVESIEETGFVVEDVRDHRSDLLEMRDTIQERVDYRPLLGLLGERGSRLLDAIDEVEDAVEDGRIGYVSLVATVDD